MQRRTILASAGAGLAASVLPWPRSGRADARALLGSIAQARRNAGLPALTATPALEAMARRQTIWMWALADTTHIDRDGRDPIERAKHAGYEGQIRGETLADTYDGGAQTVALWLAHVSTRTVLLDPNGQEIGVFGWRAADNRVWWNVIIGAQGPNQTG